MRSLRLVVGCLLVFAVSGCGDDSSDDGGLSPEEQEYVDTVMRDVDEPLPEMTSQEAECVVSSIVRAVGVDRLDEMGVTPSDFAESGGAPFAEGGFTSGEAAGVIDAWDDCVGLRQLFVAGLLMDPTIDDEVKRCMESALDLETIREVLMIALVGGPQALGDEPELQEDLRAMLEPCRTAGG